MLPILVSKVIFPYGARILVLLILSLTLGAPLWSLFKGRQVSLAVASRWKHLLAARRVLASYDPSSVDALTALTKTMGLWETSARRGAAIGGLVGAAIASLLALPLFL